MNVSNGEKPILVKLDHRFLRQDVIAVRYIMTPKVTTKATHDGFRICGLLCLDPVESGCEGQNAHEA
jgi:hypothetical protein